MADPPPYRDTNRDSSESTTGMPRWVKVSGIVALVLALLVVIMLLTGGGGGHGPRRHTRSDRDRGSETTPSSVTESGDSGRHLPPEGGHTP